MAGGPGRLNGDSRQARDSVETALFTIHALLLGVDELRIRNRQAMQRTGVVGPVLEPAVHRLDEMEDQLRRIQLELAELWVGGQAARWSE